MTSTGAGMAYSAVSNASKPYYVSRDREPAAQNSQTAKQESVKYDSLTLSVQRSGDRSFMDMVSRMSCAVRTNTTNGNIQNLRRQVASGTYEPDAYNIAAHMLLMGDES